MHEHTRRPLLTSCPLLVMQYFFANQYSTKLHIIITTSLTLAALIISLLTCDLGIVLELTGGLSATALAFIFPALCFLKLTSAPGDSNSNKGLGALSGIASGLINGWRRDRQGSVGATASQRTNGSNASYQPVSADEEEDEGHDTLENLEGQSPASTHRQSVGDISVDEVELPLRPGAQIRARRPGEGKSWWLSTKPLAVVCALFGTVVLVISGEFGR